MVTHPFFVIALLRKGKTVPIRGRGIRSGNKEEVSNKFPVG
jgi:hypothetical protein